jgi:hypothetical protein
MSPAPCTCKKSPDGLTLHTGQCMMFGAQPYSISAPVPRAESYFDVVCSMTTDPEVLAAVDRTQAEVNLKHSYVWRAGLPYHLCDQTDSTGWMVADEDVDCPACLALMAKVKASR